MRLSAFCTQMCSYIDILRYYNICDKNVCVCMHIRICTYIILSPLFQSVTALVFCNCNYHKYVVNLQPI